MKKLIIAIAISTFSYFGAGAQTLQSIGYDLTHYNPNLQDDRIINAEQAIMVTPCESNAGKVCRIGDNSKLSCYRTRYAENFKVCKGNSGYFICCENPGYKNSTHPGFTVITSSAGNTYTPPDIANYQMAGVTENNSNSQYYTDANQADDNANPTVPQSQSFTSDAGMMQEGTYSGYYPRTHGIKVCYIGDNVAENNRNPYRGCPSPQYDGPAKNNKRNEILYTPDYPDFNARLLK